MSARSEAPTLAEPAAAPNAADGGTARPRTLPVRAADSARVLRLARDAAGLTTDELGELLGVDGRRVREWEDPQHEREPRLSQLRRYPAASRNVLAHVLAAHTERHGDDQGRRTLVLVRELTDVIRTSDTDLGELEREAHEASAALLELLAHIARRRAGG